jgi:hypothetical protein
MESSTFYANTFETKNDNGLRYAEMSWSRPYTTKASAIRGLARRMNGRNASFRFITTKPIARQLKLETAQMFVNTQQI